MHNNAISTLVQVVEPTLTFMLEVKFPSRGRLKLPFRSSSLLENFPSNSAATVGPTPYLPDMNKLFRELTDYQTIDFARKHNSDIARLGRTRPFVPKQYGGGDQQISTIELCLGAFHRAVTFLTVIRGGLEVLE